MESECPVSYPNVSRRVADADALSIAFDDHREHLYLGEWTEITVGNVRLVRRADGGVEAFDLGADDARKFVQIRVDCRV